MTTAVAEPALHKPIHRPPVSGRAPKSHAYFRLRTSPALLAALCFAAGILVAHGLSFMPGLLGLALLGCFATAAVANLATPRLGWFAIAAVFILAGMFCAAIAPGVDPQQELANFADGQPRSVDGEITRMGPLRRVASSSPFSNKVREEQSQQIDLRVHAVGGIVLRDTRQSVRLSVYAPLEATFPSLACGQTLRATFASHEEERFLDPGVWDASAYLRSQGIGALGSVDAAKLSAISGTRAHRFTCWLHSLEIRASGSITAYAANPMLHHLPAFLRLKPEDAAMLAAMLTGDRSYLRHRLRVGFERTGSFHLLVVSGLHLAIFAAVIFKLAQRVRLSRVWASLLTIACASAYAVFTGFGHPVQRALGMVTIYLIGRLLWRDRSAFNAIGLVALALLAAEPDSLFDAGLQMTLLTVIAIAGVAVPVCDKTFGPYLRAMRNLKEVRIDPALTPRVAQFRVSLRMLAQHLRPLIGGFLAWRALPFAIQSALRAAELFVISLTVELFMMLPMAVYFHRVTILALPVNLLIVPFLGILLPCALLTFAMILLLPSVAILPAAATAALLHIITSIVSVTAALHAADWRIPMPSPTAIVLWIALSSAAICLVRIRRRGLTFAISALACASAAVLIPTPLIHHARQLEVTAIDVGQGDSLLVITPEGKTLLIDAGGLVGASPDSNFEVGEDVVSPVLWSRGIRRLDAIAITHAHLDHIGGMPAVLENFRPKQLWVGRNPSVPSYDRLLKTASEIGANVEAHVAGDSFAFGGISIRVLAPSVDYRPGLAPANKDSLVLQLFYGGTSALLEGDAEAPSEARMVARGGLHSDLLKVGHHGSITSTTPAFLAAVSPSEAVISVGRRNFYGHPRREVLRELQAAKVKTFLTELTGLTTFYLDGTSVSAESWRGSP